MFRLPRLAPAIALLALVPAAALAQKNTLNAGYMDKTCAPCKDFYRYANGAWSDTANIPAAYMGIGSGREIADRNQEALRRVLVRVSGNVAAEKDPDLRKVGVFYNVLMDSARADREGAAPLAPTLNRIDAIRTKAELQHEFALAALAGIGGGFGGGGVPFSITIEADPKQSTMMIAQAFQGGLGLPERDYYFRTDGKSDTLRREYVAHLGRMFQLIGESADAAAADADRVLKLETALAESSLTRVQMRDPEKLYNKITVRELGALAPAIDWNAYFGDLGLKVMQSPDAKIDVSVPMFMRQSSKLVESTPIEAWRAYLKVHYARRAANWLSQPFFDEAFSFGSKLTGAKSALPRWKRAAAAIDGAIGEPLGKAFIATEFPPSSKTRMLELVNNLMAALDERIASRPWMSEATKKQAQIKLKAIVKKIGYPDKWRDYSKLAIDDQASAVELLRRASEFDKRWEYGMIGKPVDRTLWGMTPPTVNAYYNPSFNEIVFPAGILQPPQFDPAADDAINYGAIGMVIGHEITHGFDDEGRKYDSVGNLREWWTEEDAKKFEERAQRVVDQYNGYIAQDTLHVNGKLTLGENIADLGGITVAYHAYQRSLKGKPAPVIDGLTGEQRFFLGYAQAWRRKLRGEIRRTAALTDPHSPAEWRVIGPLSNMPEFAKAFGCKAGDPMVRDESVRVEIW